MIRLFDTRIDLSNSVDLNSYESLNPFVLIDSIIQEYFRSLESKFGKTESKMRRDLILKDVIFKSYGIDSKIYSNEEIGLLISKSSERVRQLLVDFSGNIFETLMDKNPNFKVDRRVALKIIEFEKQLHGFKVMSMYNFTERYLLQQNIKIDKSKTYLLNIFFDIFEVALRSPVSFHHIKNNSFIFFDKKLNINLVFKCCYFVYEYLEKNVLAADIKDIVIDTRRKLPKVDSELIEIACNQLHEIEMVSDLPSAKYQLKAQYLSNASDKVYRLLSKCNRYLKLAEIVKEINSDLYKSGTDKKITSSVAVRLPSDNRFASQGKTGYWGLTEWNGNNETMSELITKTFLHFNKPLLESEIFDHIKKSRPQIPIRSLDTIIYDKTRYTKLNNNNFILNEWKPLYKNLIAIGGKRNIYVKENPIKEQIRQQAILLIQKNNNDQLDLNTIVNTLNKKFDYKKAAIYQIISNNDEFIKVKDKNGKLLVKLKNGENSFIKKNQTVTSVFVSYSWDTIDFQDKVISFVNFLRQNGFNADIDKRIMQDESAIDFNKLMHKGIRNYDKVIVILSSNYKKKAEAFEGG